MSDRWLIGPATTIRESLIDNQPPRVIELQVVDINTKRGFQMALSWVYLSGLYEGGERQAIMRGIRPFDMIRRWRVGETTDDDRLELDEAVDQISQL
jgi:hypothetical protein